MAYDDVDESETFVTIGTPLPAYEEDETLKKPVPIQDQKVRDSRGRQRFHGAFTGGFSAGYFNTVGSEEGWTPSTFVSSRQSRAEDGGQRPEDFMDEEDLGEFGIAPRLIKTKDEFTSNKSTQKKRSNAELIPGFGSLTDTLVVPARPRIGAQLLRKLGWKDGQGVGPRVKKKMRKKKKSPSDQSTQKVYGCAMGPTTQATDSSEDSGAEFAPEDITFAPKDVTPIDFDPKDNFHGLGYSGINRSDSQQYFSLFPEPQRSKKGKRGMTGQAFGVGALEDEDEDIYSMASMSNYNRVLDEPEKDDMHGWTAPKNRGRQAPSSYTEVILEGFKLLSTQLRPKKVYRPPEVPRGYKGIHAFSQQDINSSREAAAIPAKFSMGWKNMDASNRREALGEKPEFKSVFDLINTKDQSKLDAVRPGVPISAEQQNSSKESPTEAEQQQTDGSINNTPNKTLETMSKTPLFLGAGIADRFKSSGTEVISNTTTSSTDKPASFWRSDYKPFDKDPAKQARYEKFREHTKNGKISCPDSVWAVDLTEWESGREREEFVRACQLYKPMSGVMAARFTRAQHEDEPGQNTKGLNTKDPQLSEQAKAAKMKMYGKLTREVLEWHPDKLLCKRFNVPNPYPESAVVGLLKVKRDKYSVFNFLSIPGEEPKEAPRDEPPKKEETKPDPAVPHKKGFHNMGKPLAILASIDLSKPPPALPAADNQKNNSQATSTNVSQASQGSTPAADPTADQTSPEEPQDERPPLDLFKAIFEDSEDEKSQSEPEEEEEEEEAEEVTEKTTEVEKDEASTASVLKESMDVNERLQTALREAELLDDAGPEEMETDLDPLQKRLQEDKHSSDPDSPPDVCIVDDGTYGPMLPPGLSEPKSTSETFTSKKKKKHKEKDRHKHKKKKSKHKKSKSGHKDKKSKKKKKKSSREIVISSSSDSDSDSSSDGEVPSEQLLLEKLKKFGQRTSAADFM